MNVLLTGSIAYDRIMNFPGYFKNEIMPDKIHALNVSFFVNKLEESLGGTAGNIAYNVSLLGVRPILWGNVGDRDFSRYEQWMKKNSYDLSLLKKIKNEFTASAYIITDKADNQIAGFFPGAMLKPISKYKTHIPNADLAIVSAQNPVDMSALPELFRKKKIPFIFDPGQQVSSLSGAALKKAIAGSELLIGNDYEISLIQKKTGLNENGLLKKTTGIITTFGEKGSIINAAGKKYSIAAKKVNAIDPTGAGDAYRAGIIYGMLTGRDWENAGVLASALAAAAVTKQGTQNHRFTLK